MNKSDNKKPYYWDWSGSCVPGSGRCFATFSVGCFQWLPKKSGGLKKGRVAIRFGGPRHKPQEVYDKAQAWCDAQNAGKVLNMVTTEGKATEVQP